MVVIISAFFPVKRNTVKAWYKRARMGNRDSFRDGDPDVHRMSLDYTLWTCLFQLSILGFFAMMVVLLLVVVVVCCWWCLWDVVWTDAFHDSPALFDFDSKADYNIFYRSEKIIFRWFACKYWAKPAWTHEHYNSNFLKNWNSSSSKWIIQNLSIHLRRQSSQSTFRSFVWSGHELFDSFNYTI